MSNYEIYSAGILPYTNYKGSIYFLLGRDSDNKWSDFGGRVEPKDRGDYESTAAREFFEETLGSVYDYDYARKLIKKCPKIIKILFLLTNFIYFNFHRQKSVGVCRAC